MATLRYSCWNEKDFPGFKDSLEAMYQRSKQYYYQHSTGRDFHSEDAKREQEMIDTFFQDLEYHYVSLMKLGMITTVNRENVLNQLKSIDLVKNLPRGQRNFYGLTYKGQISINPDIEAKYGLSSDLLKQLCVSHELGHILNSSWDKDAKEFSKELYRNPRVQHILKNMGLDNPKYLEYGFFLLDEVVAEEAAERVTYRAAGRERPKREIRRDKAIFNHNPYITNYVFYGELQDFAVSFARSLSYMNCQNDSEEEVLLKLCRRSFDKNFIQKIRKEVLSNSQKLDDFVVMLACMGKIKDATYQVLGLSKSNQSLNVNDYVSSFRVAAEKSRSI